MHPNRAFEWTDRDAMLRFVDQASFATIIVIHPGGAAMVHAPVVMAGADRLRFHLSRRNVAAVPEPTRALVSVLGPHAYISPDWYGTEDQVPTWNYVAVELEGPLVRLPDEEMPTLLDALSARQEEQIPGKRLWTRDKMSAGRFEAMCHAILPYEMEIASLRGTRKLGQNKSMAEIEGACAGLRSLGLTQVASLMAGEIR
jgi:transcriptional regulator